MTEQQIAELRRLAEEALIETEPLIMAASALGRLRMACTPQTILALLDERAADKAEIERLRGDGYTPCDCSQCEEYRRLYR